MAERILEQLNQLIAEFSNKDNISNVPGGQRSGYANDFFKNCQPLLYDLYLNYPSSYITIADKVVEVATDFILDFFISNVNHEIWHRILDVHSPNLPLKYGKTIIEEIEYLFNSIEKLNMSYERKMWFLTRKILYINTKNTLIKTRSRGFHS